MASVEWQGARDGGIDELGECRVEEALLACFAAGCEFTDVLRTETRGARSRRWCNSHATAAGTVDFAARCVIGDFANCSVIFDVRIVGRKRLR